MRIKATSKEVKECISNAIRTYLTENQDNGMLTEYFFNKNRTGFQNKALGNSNVDTLDVTINEVPGQILKKGKDGNVDTGKKLYRIMYHNLTDEEVQEIYNKFTNDKSLYVNRALMPKGKNIKNGIVALELYKDNIENWLYNGGADAVEEILRKSGAHNTQEVDDMKGIISNRITTDKEISKIENEAGEKAIDMWLKYLEKLQDPETQKLLQAYSSVLPDKVFGHVLSMKNAVLIRAIDPTATFILPESTWVHLGRRVKPGARKFVVLAPPNDNEFTREQRNEAMKKLGWGEYKYKDLPLQAKIKVDVECNEEAHKYYTRVIEFDVKDTDPIPGMEDKFMTQPGLANNLTGELNAKAKEQSIANTVDTEDNEMKERTQLAADYMLNKCKKEKINVATPTENTDPSDVLVNCLNAYYLAYAEKAGNLDKDTNKKIFAENATHFTLMFTKLAWDRMYKFAHSTVYTKKEAAEFLNLVCRVVNGLRQAVSLNESMGGVSRQEILSAFKDFCKQNNIKIEG